MAGTDTLNVDLDEFNGELALFDSIDEELKSISQLLDIKDKLIPKAFYKDISINNEEVNTYANTFVNKIAKVKGYINNIIAADNSGELVAGEEVVLADKATGDITPNDANEMVTSVETVATSSDTIPTTNVSEKVTEVGTSYVGGNTINITGGSENIGLGGVVSSGLGNIAVDAIDEKTSQLKDDTTNIGDTAVSSGENEINLTNNIANNVNNVTTVSGENIIKRIYDLTGNLVAVATQAGDKEIWYQVVNGKILESTASLGNTFYLHESVSVVVDGKEITINPGSYEIEQVFSNPDGSLAGIRIIAGDYKIQLHYDTNGNITKVEYIRSQNGVFVINTSDYKVVDMFGNTIDKFTTGNYYIYDVLYDDKGNIEAFNLSPEGEYEKWLYLDETVDTNSYSLFDSTKGQSNSKASISLFDGNKALFGLLGVLFVALGTTIVLKKKHDKKYNSLENNDDSEEWTEESLPSGNYAIYDVKKSDDGLITEARINPLDSDEEYWVEM